MRSLRGPQGYLDLLMLQQFGGLGAIGRGISFSQLNRARKQMESGRGFTGKNVGGFLDELMRQGGGGAGGEFYAQQSLLQLGVPVGTEMMEGIARYRRTGELDPSVAGKLQSAFARDDLYASGGLKAQTEGRADTQLTEMAKIADNLLNYGAALEKGFVAMQAAQAQIDKALSQWSVALSTTGQNIGDLGVMIGNLTDSP